jgi:hypothetical protein
LDQLAAISRFSAASEFSCVFVNFRKNPLFRGFYRHSVIWTKSTDLPSFPAFCRRSKTPETGSFFILLLLLLFGIYFPGFSPDFERFYRPLECSFFGHILGVSMPMVLDFQFGSTSGIFAFRWFGLLYGYVLIT